MVDLRTRLRRETAEAHERLDLSVTAFGMDSAEGREGLCAALSAGYRAVLGLRYAPASKARDIALRPILAQGQVPPASDATGAEIDERAASYVFVGAHLGMRVLALAWERETGAVPPPPLGMPPLGREWREVREDLSAMPAEGPAADRIVADANRLFDAFHAGVLRARRTPARAA